MGEGIWTPFVACAEGRVLQSLLLFPAEIPSHGEPCVRGNDVTWKGAGLWSQRTNALDPASPG